MNFYDKVSYLCFEARISITSLAKELGFSESTLAAWESSKELPCASTIEKISEYFGISIKDFLSDIETEDDDEEFDSSGYNQPIWQNILEKCNYNEKAAHKAYAEYEDACMQDAMLDNLVYDASNRYIPKDQLSDEEKALLELFNRTDYSKRAQLLDYAAKLACKSSN